MSETIIVAGQIEPIDAGANRDEIQQVSGLNLVVLGPNHLSGSLGVLG